MLKNSRVTGALDTSRLGKALAGPGMDTRTWVSLAIVSKVTIDPDEGIFADVTLMPLGKQATARVGVEYAGNGFGIYAPLLPDDEVLVEAPNGDTDNGLIVTRRLYSPSDQPPSEASQFPDDFLLVAASGKTVRILVEGSGQVEIRSRNGQARRLAFKDELDALANMIIIHTHPVPGVTPGVGAATSAPTTTPTPTAIGTEYLRAE